jgi:fibro-slime domain-containing protein
MRSPKLSKSSVYLLIAGAFAAVGACSFTPGDPKGSAPLSSGNSGSPGSPSGTGGVFGQSVSGTGGSYNGTAGSPPVTGIPADFTRGDIGAWKVGNPISATGAPPNIDTPPGGCYQLLGVVRDFKGFDEGGHPDFETYAGGGATTGLVSMDLGADRKPVYASTCEKNNMTGACPHGPQTTSAADFMPWYHSTDPVNKAFEIYFILEPNNGKTTFQSRAFFPLDEAKVPMSFGNNGRAHNFGFTTELHTKFVYRGGEMFTFEGDDDLWVFVNKKLALDLGGLHPQVMGTIDMDAQAAQLGIQKGKTYDLELFHAERHTNASNFRVDTNFVFVDCGVVIP